MKPHSDGSRLAAAVKPISEWLNKRTGLDRILRETLDEPIPGGARFAYVFGSALIFIFMSQVITGVFLALYYVASADHAHTTVAYISKQVASGSFIRSIHAYGSSAMVILLLLHVTQTFLYGSYKGRRELLWLAGCVLFALTLCMAFTGYLLPWDQKAYFATAVGTNIAGEVPLIGPWVKSLMRGGVDMGTLTLSRFFVAHVLVLPAAIFAFTALHVLLFRKAGAAGPIDEHPVIPTKPVQLFYPRQVLVDAAFALLIVLLLALLSYFRPFELGPKASPADTRFLPRPEWYYIPVFQWLKYWPGPLAVFGAVVIPGIIAFLFASLPFLDRRLERRPWKRPIAVSSYVFIFLALFGLGAASHASDQNNPGYAAQLAVQQKETEEFMKAPFEPEVVNLGQTAASAESASSAAAKGAKLYTSQFCAACHGEGGAGSAAGPKLKGLHTKMSADQIASVLKSPSPKMHAGGMMPSRLQAEDMQALVAYLGSL